MANAELRFSGSGMPASAPNSVADALHAWAQSSVNDGGNATPSFVSVVLFGDAVWSSEGRELMESVEAVTRKSFAGLPLSFSVTEGPRDNHSRLEMSSGARNEGLFVLVTDALHDARMEAGSDYLAMQCLATFQSFVDRNRRVCLVSIIQP